MLKARRLGVPHLWPSRVKVFFLAILTSVFNFSVFQYLHNANVAYLNLSSPSYNEIVCKLPREECASNPDPASCTVDLEDRLLSSDEPEIEIPDREVSSDSGLRQKQLKLVLAEMGKCEEAREVGLLAESAVELVNLYEKQSRSIQLDTSDAGDASKAEQCKALDAQKAALLAARMALKDREWALVEAKHRAQQLEEERLQQDYRIRALQTALDKALSSRTEAEKRHLEAYSTADAEAAEQRGELRKRLSDAEVARDQAMADLAAVEERIEEARRVADRREEDLLSQLAAQEAQLQELQSKLDSREARSSPEAPSEAKSSETFPPARPSFRLQGMPSGGLTEESHIQGVGMVMATPRLHYNPPSAPRAPKPPPTETRGKYVQCLLVDASEAAQNSVGNVLLVHRLISHALIFHFCRSFLTHSPPVCVSLQLGLVAPGSDVRNGVGWGRSVADPDAVRSKISVYSMTPVTMSDGVLVFTQSSEPDDTMPTPTGPGFARRGSETIHLVSILALIWLSDVMLLFTEVMLWSLFQAVAFMVVMYPFSLLVCVYAPVKMSRIMVFLSSILCAMWAVVFVVFTSLVDTHAYAVLWGVSEPGASTSCLCLCEFPLSRPVVLRIVVLGIGVCWHSINLTLRALKGLRRAQWANMFSVLYSVPVEAFPVVWERPQEAGGGPVKWRTEGEAMQSEPAFDPFCLMDEQPESAWTRAIIAPVPVKDDSRLTVWEPYLGTLDMEIGWCGFPRPVGGAWERDTDCESESLKSRDDADTAMQEVTNSSSCRADPGSQNGTSHGIWSRKVKKRPPPMLFLHTEVEEDEAEEVEAASGADDVLQVLRDWDNDPGPNGSRPASASNISFNRRLSDAQDIFHMGGLADLRPPTPASGASGPPSAPVSRQPTPTEQSHRSAPSIVGRRTLTPGGPARSSRGGPPGPPFLV
ncbi:unnamed protein product [Symbiodinium pilosum]|uniref:Uncharacterized protein n=1 Tax=Symbiodinium pilosum TaxID=2952 RepID=A0A812X579_SYMPI|nr:unnamed protein product [Symbiodinium pilosum]